MKIVLEILRWEVAGVEAPEQERKAWWQSIPYETADPAATVASALQELEEMPDLRDVDGKPVKPVQWECSCLQKKCGACAMVINGKPGLACDTFLRDYAKKGKITLEPLRKFPVVEDLIVDRSIMRENLKAMQIWAKGEALAGEDRMEDIYAASRCLQCGCCLEVCPQFAPGDPFFGTAASVPAARLLFCETDGKAEAGKQYRKHIYEGCGKSLACRDVCPAGIDLDRLLSRSNALAIWRRKR